MRTGSETLYVDDEIFLVPRRGDDAPEMFAILERHRTDLREWLTWVDATRSLNDVKRYAQFARAQFESGVAFDYAIRAGNVFAGAIGIHSIDWSTHSGQIGYWMAPQARGRGIVTRAAAALVTYALAHLDIHRVEIRCVVENERSRAVPVRLGFAFEGILSEAYFLHGRFRDIALYATTKTRWHPPAASADPLGG